MNKIFRSLIFYLILLLASIAITTYMSSSGEDKPKQNISYSEFVRLVNADQVTELHTQGTEAVGKQKNGGEFVVTLPEKLPDAVFKKLTDSPNLAKWEFVAPAKQSWFWTLAYSVLPVLLVLGAFFFIMQQTQGSGNRVMQFGKSRARLHNPDERRKVTFEDVAGIDEVKEELVEIVDFLKHPKRYMELGARIPKGVLLFGPPGTGKTLLARAIAGEAGAPFFSISGSDFVEMFVGVGASRVRDLFDQAKKNSPCIVFIDEIDAVGRMRGAGYGGGHDEREQTLNQLLVEMDGFGVNEGIIVVAATNRPDVLDPALLRPGRFDRHVVIDKPDLNGRKAILGVHAKGKPISSDVDLEVLAKRTPGFTGADLANLLNEAALLAARKRRKNIAMEDLEQAIDRVISGGPEKRSRIISEKEKRITAYHEAGHALVGAVLPYCDPVHKVTIIPRGRALGLTYSLPVEDRYINSKPELMDRMAMALGGRAAEELIFGDLTSGAQGDIEWVTNIARRMVTEWGMSERLGPLTFGTRHDEVFLGRDIARQRNYSEEVAALIDEEVRSLVTEAHDRANQVIREQRNTLDKLAQSLLEKETLEGVQLEGILNEARENRQEKPVSQPDEGRPKEVGRPWLRGNPFEPQPAG